MKPIQEMNVIELKARGYDLMANIQFFERELAQVNQLIAQKAAMEEQKPKEEVKENEQVAP